MNYKGFNDYTSVASPNVEISEGVKPAQFLIPAGYLPLQRLDKRAAEYKVISRGKVVALDSTNLLVPAGLAIDIETAIAATDFDDCVMRYTAKDVEEGVKNAHGTLVTLDEAVVASFFTDSDATKTQLIFVGKPIGIVSQDVYRQDGAGYGSGYSAGLATDYTYAIWNLQNGVSVTSKYFIELPVVANTSAVKMAGIAVFKGTPKPGDLVSFDVESNFIVAPTPTTGSVTGADAAAVVASVNTQMAALIADMNKKAGRILGRVWLVNDQYPKGYLEYVKTWEPANVVGNGDLDKKAGSATNGLPENLYYAGVTSTSGAKTVRINMVL